jgi:hypothetical protein
MTPRELIEQQDARFLVSDNLRWWLFGTLVGLLLLAVMGWRAEADAKIEQAERLRALSVKAAREDRRKCIFAKGLNEYPPALIEACTRTVSRM